MNIQNLLLPELGICTEEALYFHREKDREREINYIQEEGALKFINYAQCFFDTYFNGFSIEKWKKYTTIGDISLHITVRGRFEVSLLNCRLSNGGVCSIILDRITVKSKEKKEFILPYKLYEYKGIITFGLKALEDDSIYYGGYYDAIVEDDKLYNVDLAINICTYKREPYVRRNIDNLKKSIIGNVNSPLYNHVMVYISDNGGTLTVDEADDSYINIVKNKNVGGAGGFTRGLIEIIHDNNKFNATHALMMDDDVIIIPEALFRTYMMLRLRKKEYQDMFIGGAMLRTDYQAVQVEAGASWNEGKLVSNKAGMDLNDVENCLINEVEEYTEYNAWWYCCIPMKLISRKNLPLPIFIRGDDLEYGLRNRTTVVLLNGICVWHEPFENKYSSYLQYYILRNLLYDNALHFPKYKLSAFLYRLYTTVGRELIYYRYKNIKLLFRGVYDFYKGVDFLKSTDGEMLHKEIMQSGYSAVPVENIENAAYRLPKYQQSFKQRDRGITKAIRYITINGYLLPAKKAKGKDIQVVSMSLCRPINFYRQKRVMNYDESSGKAFITEKSWKATFGVLFGLIKITCLSIFAFNHTMKKFRKESNELMDEGFWKQYLDCQ